MRKVVLFIAMSLDGFIADRRGGVDWLSGQGSGASFDAYGAFIQNVDTVLMGWNTYHQIITELAPGEWPYTGLACYVFTHRVQPAPGPSSSRRTPVPRSAAFGRSRGRTSGSAAGPSWPNS